MDKRAAVRVPVRARAQFRVDGVGVVIDGVVEDVSRSGLFMRAPRSIEAGSSAELVLDLPGEPTLHLKAEVVRVEEDGEVRPGIALRFVGDVEARLRRPLANFIMRQHSTITTR